MTSFAKTKTFPFDNTYARLPERFYARVVPTKVREPRIIKVNRALAELLGGDPDQLASTVGVEVLAGNVVPEGADPIALAYAGHQFGVFVPQLGDGRAILLGEVLCKDGVRRDIQLKGAGQTPFSRNGDGRSALGPVLREYIVSEAMAALGIPTTRALAAVTTGEDVVRELLLPGAVFARVATSHIRVGTFEFFSARNDNEALTILATYALARNYPDAAGSGNDALALLEHVIEAQALLVARWLGVGFVHGVMNTDNMSISGETIDYGPCAFIDEYDPQKKFSSIDCGGRYALANQPSIAQWNLARLAESLLPLLCKDIDEAVRIATERLDQFSTIFETAHTRVLCSKLGLKREDQEVGSDRALVSDLLERLALNHVDYTLFFRHLCKSAADPSADAEVASLFAHPGAFHDWAVAWRRRMECEDLSPQARGELMRSVNPAFIPRNHRVEEVIAAAVEHADLEPFETLVRVLARPYEDQPELARFTEPPKPDQRVYETFCGT